MAKQHANLPAIKWQIADMLALPFADASFDAIIDKAGSDVLFTDAPSPWQLPEATRSRVHTMLQEAHRWGWQNILPHLFSGFDITISSSMVSAGSLGLPRGDLRMIAGLCMLLTKVRAPA